MQGRAAAKGLPLLGRTDLLDALFGEEEEAFSDF